MSTTVAVIVTMPTETCWPLRWFVTELESGSCVSCEEVSPPSAECFFSAGSDSGPQTRRHRRSRSVGWLALGRWAFDAASRLKSAEEDTDFFSSFFDLSQKPSNKLLLPSQPSNSEMTATATRAGRIRMLATANC